MRLRSSILFRLFLVLAPTVVVGAVVTFSIPKPAFTKHDKAYYADPKLINFVRPGLVIKVQGVNISSDGTVRVQFRVADLKGLPLDLNGVNTPGEISVNFVIAYIPQGQQQYVSYTTHFVGPPETKMSGNLPHADIGGVFQQLSDGVYQYTFATKLPAGFDTSATHTVGAFASRSLTDFDLGTQFSNDVYTFVPSGAAVTQVRDIIRTASCDKCHGQLAYHEGKRREVALCVLCHTPQNQDLNTGQALDFRAIIHKIHAGADVDSVAAGGTFVISVHDFTGTQDYSIFESVADARNCQSCHEAGPAQADAWKTNPSRAACGSCHDLVNFGTGENHVDLPQVDDKQCTNCHFPKGELEFDTSIIGAHTVPNLSTSLPGVVVQFLRVDNAGPGKKPTVVFTLKDNSGSPIAPSQMDLLALVIAGPTTDYSYWFREDATGAQAGSDGTVSYTFKEALSANAQGTYTVGIEGSRPVTLLAGTRKEVTAYDFIRNQMFNFSVDGSPIQPRRTIVSAAKCASCHPGPKCLSCHVDTPHAGNRNNFDYCALCHNPNETDASQRPADQMPAESMDLAVLVHKIHTGENRVWRSIYGIGGIEDGYDTVRFPGDRGNCEACHVNGSEQLPLPAGLLPVLNPNEIPNPRGKASAACLGCHDTQAAHAHALVNTSSILGESCDVCHGQDAEFSVSRVHAR
ncbi:MAG: OmcA/MtrC family decaheme c-type cytochrome [Acidobacteria bacterium]|nr:OmcA/MtrC family decaheme c-type cytochrome [Acidobacteriota bacterium]